MPLLQFSKYNISKDDLNDIDVGAPYASRWYINVTVCRNGTDTQFCESVSL